MNALIVRLGFHKAGLNGRGKKALTNRRVRRGDKIELEGVRVKYESSSTAFQKALAVTANERPTLKISHHQALRHETTRLQA